jgi:hypothetical protein
MLLRRVRRVFRSYQLLEKDLHLPVVFRYILYSFFDVLNKACQTIQLSVDYREKHAVSSKRSDHAASVDERAILHRSSIDGPCTKAMRSKRM